MLSNSPHLLHLLADERQRDALRATEDERRLRRACGGRNRLFGTGLLGRLRRESGQS
jgi:hypothetical protein